MDPVIEPHPAASRPVIDATAHLALEFKVAAAKPLRVEGPLNKASLHAKIDQHTDRIKDANEVLAYLNEAQAPQSCDPAPALASAPISAPVLTLALVLPHTTGSIVPKQWIQKEIVDLLEAKVPFPEGISKDDFSELISDRMHTAAETMQFLHPVGPKYISNISESGSCGR